jgi:hypothetical protein
MSDHQKIEKLLIHINATVVAKIIKQQLLMIYTSFSSLIVCRLNVFVVKAIKEKKIFSFQFPYDLWKLSAINVERMKIVLEEI